MPNVKVGNEVVKFPDSMTESQIINAIRDLEISQMPMGIPTAATVEPAIAMAGGLAGQVAGGLSGLTRAGGGYLFSDESGEEAMKAGADVSQSVSEAVSRPFAPKTQFGARGMDVVSKPLEAVGGAIEQVSQYLGDKTFAGEMGGAFGESLKGSPAAATAAYMAPEIVLSILPSTLIRRIAPSGKYLDASGNPTPELLQGLRSIGLSWQDLTDVAKKQIPQTPQRSLVAGTQLTERSLDPARAAQISSGGSEASLAPLMAAGSKTTKDPLAQSAILQWDDKGLIQAVKTASSETRGEMLKMLDLRSRIDNNKRLAQTTRPSDIAGDAAVKRVSYLRGIANSARVELDKIAKEKLAGQQIDVQPVVETLNSALNDLKVRVVQGDNGLPTPVFEESLISANPSSKKVIKTLFKLMAEGGAPDALRLHDLKRQLDELIDFKKSQQGGLTGSGKSVLKTVRASINDQLRLANPDYAKTNDTLSEILTVFDDFDSVSGRRTDIFGSDAASKLGQEFRKLFSNYGVRTDLMNSISGLDNAAAKYGAQFRDSIMDLSMFANALDDRFGPVAGTSFRGEIAAANKQAANEALRSNWKDKVIDKAMEAYQSARGVSDDRAYGVMEELLKRQGAYSPEPPLRPKKDVIVRD